MSQANACGKEDYEDVEQLEIIFDEAAEIGSIDCMYRLRSLTSTRALSVAAAFWFADPIPTTPRPVLRCTQ